LSLQYLGFIYNLFNTIEDIKENSQANLRTIPKNRVSEPFLKVKMALAKVYRSKGEYFEDKAHIRKETVLLNNLKI